ncbi:MAG: substrate-binding domain-containing protein, partial [Sphingobium sp.]
ADYRLGLYASRDYIRDHGAVQDIEDLRSRTLIGYIPDFIYADELRYLHEVDVQLSPNFASSSINVQHAMVRGGIGVAILPNFIGLNDPVLVPQLADAVMVQRSFWVVVHHELRRLARVSAVMEWLQQAVQEVAGPPH